MAEDIYGSGAVCYALFGKKRFEFTLKLINEFNVSGLLWYGYYAAKHMIRKHTILREMKENNIPMLIIESNYDVSNIAR